MKQQLCVGIDLGTSGVRAAALDADGQCLAEASHKLPAPELRNQRLSQDPQLWWQAVQAVLKELLRQNDPQTIAALAVDGTSGTLLMCDADGSPLTPALMYNDSSCIAQSQTIARLAPADSVAQGNSSSLARLLYLQEQAPQARHAMHQADWIAGCLIGRFGQSDENNVLKLGYDPVQRRWPDWFAALDVKADLLPDVAVPGQAIGPLVPALARRWGMSPDTLVAAGTTDGVAAFLATGADRLGDAVTSLGSTLVLKLLCDRPLSDPASGVYSHRLGDLWLPGGASNSGGAALLVHFSAEQMRALTPDLQPDQATGLDYYPLPASGERFPVNDPTLASRVSPRPAQDAVFLQGLLEGVTQVEALGYQRLQALGAPRPHRLFTVGGGASNPAWQRLRERMLGLPLLPAAHQQAACGTARLAWRALREQAA